MPERAPTADSSPATPGYCLLPALIDTPTLTALRAAITHLIATRDPTAGVDVRAGTEWMRTLRGTLPEVDALAEHPRVQAALAPLLGPAPLLDGIRLRNPVGRSAHQALHVDAAGPVTPGDDQLAQVLLFLDDVDHGNGPTHLVPGTHRSGAVPGRDHADAGRRHPDEVAIICQAGDALIFSSHLWHRGTANISGRPRRAITYAFRRSPA